MSTKQKNIALLVLVAVFLFGFSLWSILKPAGTESVSERRPLAQFPAVNSDSVLSGQFMTDFEKYTLDQFPLRDQFRTVKAFTAFYAFRQQDNNDIYVRDGYAAKLEYPMDTESIAYALKRFQFVYDTYFAEKDLPVYVSVIPDKNYFLAEENGYPSMDYDAFVAQMRDGMAYAKYIDVMPLLEKADYYSTDTHWRQEKIPDVAQHLAEEMGVHLTAEYEQVEVDVPFYGVYYGQSALPLPADTLYYLDNDVLRDCSVYDFETNTEIPVYDLEKTKGNDPYEMFLSGSKSLLTIENPNATTKRELIIFRDSFGSSITPLLAEGYAKITLVDIRYFSPNVLGQFLTFADQDVLFLYSTSVLNNSITIK